MLVVKERNSTTCVKMATESHDSLEANLVQCMGLACGIPTTRILELILCQNQEAKANSFGYAS